METVGKLVGITGHSEERLNGCRGKIIGHEAGYWLVHVHVPDTQQTGAPRHGAISVHAKIHHENLILVPDHWAQQTRRSSFNQEGMLTYFQAPELDGKIPIPNWFDFGRHDVPSTEQVKAFWGPSIFKFMVEQLNWQLQNQRHPKELQYFKGSDIACGLVFSDGSCATQQSPITSDELGLWWPILFATRGDQTVHVAGYCQAQALNGGRAWVTHISRVVCLRRATAEHFPQQPPQARPPLPHPPVHSTVVVVVVEEIRVLRFQPDAEPGTSTQWGNGQRDACKQRCA